MDKMKFSIVIPVYNSEQYLSSCIESIINQTFHNYEIILIDDNSSDTSLQICNHYQLQYPDKIIVSHQENQGPLITRINGVNLAKGRYCIFVDADDVLINNALDIINLETEQYDNPDMLIYSFYYENERKIRTKADKIFNEGSVKKEELFKSFFLNTGLNNIWTKAVKRNILINLNFDFNKFAHLRSSEDRLYSMIISDNCKTVVYTYKQIYIYRLISGSITRNYTINSIKKFNTSDLYNTEINFIKKWNLSLPEWQFRLDAVQCKTALYILDLFYKNTKRKTRQEVIKYDWSDFLNESTLIHLQENPYLNDTQRKLWNWIIKKNYTALNVHFLKKTLRKLLKKRLFKDS